MWSYVPSSPQVHFVQTWGRNDACPPGVYTLGNKVVQIGIKTDGAICVFPMEVGITVWSDWGTVHEVGICGWKVGETCMETSSFLHKQGQIIISRPCKNARGAGAVSVLGWAPPEAALGSSGSWSQEAAAGCVEVKQGREYGWGSSESSPGNWNLTGIWSNMGSGVKSSKHATELSHSRDKKPYYLTMIPTYNW